ncbi:MULTISPECIES: hypothetical protein [unclassified Mesorhizobium]|uniref:hypothetical protein n=1 Tax=unclassified Mesorhizobium TaxID=325217 RepID=UPI0003CDD8B0|nr:MULTISPECIES: hypothetical protein [unclassified Mesorhizobium]ESX82671.1 hypothetical protein X756_31105 [Mesorhizobium sp. LSHC412B00]ESZ77539.1 hypothetical protein X726_11230 [Mesorhizobium sp. L103C105A0]
MKVERAEVESYDVYLKDKSRPPSRSGNKHAWHSHVLVVAGETYSFLAPWSGKFVYKNEVVSFEWQWSENQKYRNIDRGTVIAWTPDGEHKLRGERGSKVWRTADTRPPGRRTEWDD